MNLKYYYSHRFLWVMFFFTCLMMSLRAENIVDAPMKRILIIDSYASADVWTVELKRGIQDFLYQTNQPATFETYELAIRFKPGLIPALEDIVALNAKLQNSQYDLVIVSNNAAADLFLNQKLQAPAEIPILVSSYHGDLQSKIPAGMNMTGVVTPNSSLLNLEIAKQLYNDKRPIVMISEATADGMAQMEIFNGWKKNHGQNSPEIRFLNGRDYSTEEMLNQIAALPKESIVIFNSWGSIKDKNPPNYFTILPRIRKSFDGLILGRYEEYINLGSAGGSVISGYEQGKQAGEIANKIFSGQNAFAVDIQQGKVHTVFDMPSIIQHNVKISQLPKDVTLLNLPPSWFDKYQKIIIFAISGIGLLFAIFSIRLLILGRMKKRVTAMFDNLPLRVGVADMTGKILYYHIPQNEPQPEWMPFAKLTQLPDEIRINFEQKLRETFKSNSRQQWKYEHNETKRHVEFVPLPEHNAFNKKVVMWISSDQTALHQAHQMVSRIAEQFRLTLESIGDGVIATDKDEHITLLNPIASQMTGYTIDEAKGKPLTEVFNIVSYIDGKQVESPLTKALLTGEIVELSNHTDLISKNGTALHIADSAAPIRNNEGEIIGGILVFRDVTKEYEERDKLRNALAQLELGSRLTRSESFRMNLNTREIIGSQFFSEIWPMRDGKPVLPEEFVYPADLADYIRRSQDMHNGKKDEDEWNYRAIINGELRDFRMIAQMDRSRPDADYLLGVIQDVTEITRNVLKLKATTELWELVLNTIPVMIFVKNAADDFRYMVANKAFGEFIGHPVEKIIGHNDYELFKTPEDIKSFREKDEEIMRGNVWQEFVEFPYDSKGNRLQLRTTKIPFTDAIGNSMLLGMTVDVTAINALAANEKVLNFCLETFFNTSDIDEAIHRILEAICLHTRATRAYMLHLDMEQCSSTCFSEYAVQGHSKIFEDNTSYKFSYDEPWVSIFENHEYLFLPDLKDPKSLEKLGSWNQIIQQFSTFPLYAAGVYTNDKLWGDLELTYEDAPVSVEQFNTNFLQAIQHLLGLLLERKYAHEKIINALNAAKAADRAKSYFIATVSHEIRTPLNAVIGLSELLKEGSLPEHIQKDYLNGIACSGNALLQLINDVLDLSKLEAGQMQIAPHPIDFADLCREVISVFSYSAESKGLALKSNFSPMPALSLDKLRLRQILFNLIGNAVKFTDSGSVEISAEFTPDDNSCGTLTFHVCDTGRGIALEEQHNLFDPFVQAGTIRGTYASGNSTGLGLAISKRLLECMNGEISLESTIDEGSCFSVSIKNVEFGQCETPKEMPKSQYTEMKKFRILIVDDVPLNLKVLRAMLEKIGCEVFNAESAAVALEFLESNEVDWVLTDLWMPDMDGSELAIEIRRRWPAEKANMKIVAVSADSESYSNFDMRAINDILLKPVSLEKLKKIIF